MNPITLEWIDKANGDLQTAQREYRARKFPNYDAVCFHAQQTAEKMLKAILQENKIPIPRPHSLAELLAIINKIDPVYLLIQPDAIILEGYAVQFRYPGLSANRDETKAALSAARNIQIYIQNKLNS